MWCCSWTTTACPSADQLRLKQFDGPHSIDFLGLAQASNHINNGVHVRGPCILAIARSALMQLGRPVADPPRGDAAEELSWRAEEEGLPYKAWYQPPHPSREGLAHG